MNEILIKILNNIGTFAITMFGVEITIFTVIYSFIVSKRAYFKAINHDIKIQKTSSTYLHTERKFSVGYIRTLKKINKFVLILAAISLILYGWSLFTMPVEEDNLSFSQLILACISVIYIISTLTLLVIYIIRYFKEVKF